MELKIISKEEKPLLLRTEITAEVFFDGKTPSKDEVKKAVLKEVKVDESFIVIKKIRVYFGVKKATITAYVYNNKGDMEKIEPKKKEKKGKEEKTESKLSESQAKPEKKESPKEEKKEEKKKEKKEEKEGKKESPKEEAKEKGKADGGKKEEAEGKEEKK